MALSGFAAKRRTGAGVALLAAECGLYAAFILAGIAGREPFTPLAVRLQYASIALAPVVCALFAGPERDRRDFALLMAALCASVANESGALFFSYGVTPFVAAYGAVQILYLVRHGRGRPPRPIPSLIALALWAAAAAVAAGRGMYPDRTVILAVCAYGFLFTLGLAAVWGRPNPAAARWGLTLFAGCDFCLMLYYAMGRAFFPGMLVWVFFLPGQVLLALSAVRRPDGPDEPNRKRIFL